MTNGELERLLEAIETKWSDRLDAEIRRVNDLRQADLLAREVAFSAVQNVMTGFPQEYARRGDLETIRETAVRLDRESVKREPYEQSHGTLEARVDEKLDRQVFVTALTEWTTWRDGVNQRLNAQQGISQGVARTFTWALLGLGGLATAVALILSLN
jgi:hypothetical protein